MASRGGIDGLTETCCCCPLIAPLNCLVLGRVYFLKHRNKLSFKEAVQACAADGGQIVKVGQLYAAWRLMGLDRCDAGWLADGSVRYSITTARANRGPPRARGVQFWVPPSEPEVWCVLLSVD